VRRDFLPVVDHPGGNRYAVYGNRGCML